MTTLKPLAGYLLVKRVEAEQETASGIILTEANKEKPQKGEVIAVGAAKEGKDSQVKVGDTVLFKKYGPTEVNVDGEELLILEEEDLLAVYQ